MAPIDAIVGAGALGQAFAAHLCAAGQPVVLVGTERSTRALLEAGCIRVHGATELTIPVAPAPTGRADGVTVTSSAGDVPHGAGMLFTTKAHQLPGASDAMVATEPAWVAGLQ